MRGERFSARGHARRSGACGELPPGAPERLIADRAYDSDALDAENGIELIAPQRRNRKKAKTQDGRRLRRYKRR
jgi:hypothetical protein